MDVINTMTQSQKSCTCPSPETEEDQGSRMSSKKKESRFRRFKERLIENVRRDRTNKSKKGTTPTTCTVKAHKVNPSHSESKKAYNTPDDGIVKTEHKIHSYDRNAVHRHAPESKVSYGWLTGDNGPKIDKSTGLLKIIRNSFRRLKKDKPKQPDIECTLQKNEEIHQENPTPQSKTPPPESAHPSLDDFMHEDDDITYLFQQIIECLQTRKPDRKKLRLDGLVKCKPASFDRLSPAGRKWPGVSSDLTPDVETDGLGGHNVAGLSDGPTLPTGGLHEVEDESDGEIGDQNDKQRVCNAIADRLKTIGDSIAFKRSSESDFDVESYQHGRRRSSLDLFLVEELRKYADENTLFKSAEAQLNVAPVILLAIKSLIKAQTYDDFKQAVTRELTDTIGWEQVAWYTYLVQMSMLVTKGGKWAGQSFRDYATRHFQSNIRPFIRSRPNGWESIHD